MAANGHFEQENITGAGGRHDLQVNQVHNIMHSACYIPVINITRVYC